MLVLLDAYHLSDPLFVTGLARDLAARGRGGLLVHGSAERGERALEGLGAAPTQEDGVWGVEDAEQAAAVERATRDLNREIVHELNEAGTAAIRMMGADRGMIKLDDSGAVTAARSPWLAGLVQQGVVVVLAALVRSPGGGALREIDSARAAGALADRMGQAVTVLLRSQTLAEGPLSLSSTPEVFGDPGAVGRLLAGGVEVVARSRAQLRDGGQGAEKRVVA